MSEQQVDHSDIPVPEKVEDAAFFWTNREMLGFTNPARTLVMCVKEFMDNCLDACEDIGIRPDIHLDIEDIETEDGTELVRIVAEDNAGGLPPEDVPNIFGQVLYSSRFGRWRQSRGQQGIGVSGVFLESQRTEARPMVIRTKQKGDDLATEIKLWAHRKGKDIDHEVDTVEWDKEHGTRIQVDVPASWRSKSKLLEYIEGTSIANPSADITFRRRRLGNDWYTEHYERTAGVAPNKPEEIKPHPHAADKGELEDIILHTEATKARTLLKREFCRVGREAADEICEMAGVDPDLPIAEFSKEIIADLATAMQEIEDIESPPTTPLNPLGEELIEKALSAYNPEYMGVSQRAAGEIEGHPFIVETGIAYGGDISSDGEVDYYRVANRVPLVYDEGSCALSAVTSRIDWSTYGLEQGASGVPVGPAVVFVHLCSTRVPFDSEAKTFVSRRPEIMDEVELSLRECGREFSKYLKKKQKRQDHKKKVEELTPIYDLMAQKVGDVVGKDKPEYLDALGGACNTIVIDESSGRVWNPNGKNKNIEVNGDSIELGPGESIDVDDPSEVSYTWEPVRVGQ